ncbi:MAG: aromatic amino acid lyase [Bacteroidetes bacterium]|nr:aromatic amino acid lyase [Bacteroidota bacterium]
MVELNESHLSAEDFFKVIYGGEKIRISASLAEELDANFQFLKEFSVDKVIYGINTGFGPMAQYKVPYAERLALQYNLIRSHASGLGEPLSPLYAKAMLLDRLNTFAKCRSGVHPDLLALIAEMLNHDVLPVIYTHGGVGASGDLVQLAHMALAIIGEGQVYYQDCIVPAAEALRAVGLTPFAIRLREGLGMMNGTSCMTGIGMVNVHRAKQLLHISVLLSATINEIFRAYADHFSAPLNEVKKHRGQNAIAAQMRDLLSESRLLRSRQEHLYRATDETHFVEKVQEYYSIRCVPQILGPVYDTIEHAAMIVNDELNSVSDNPVVDHQRKDIYHGGNFHGDYIGLEMDKLKIAITKLSMMADRQLNYLLNDKLNGKLPPFINRNTIGLNFGLQGIQYTATSTVAENQTLSNPMYVHSIPSNNDNQDLVSMGSNAALICARVIDNTFEVLAIHTMAVVEAIEALEVTEQLSPKVESFYNAVRQVAKPIGADEPKYADLARIKELLKETDIEA